MTARALPTAALALLAATAAASTAATAAAASGQALHDISDEQFYQMPRLFHLDPYEECLAARGVYCVGSFELSTDDAQHQLFQLMQRYSSNWVDNFNHTRLHRGLCVSRRCAAGARDGAGASAAGASAAGASAAGASADGARADDEPLDAWFASCVNASTMSSYQLSARLYRLEYCERGAGAAAAPPAPLAPPERALAGLLAALLVLAALSTALDLTLTDHNKKSLEWALAWSVRGCWRALRAAPPAAGADLAALDGLKVLGMLCFIVEHVCWLNVLTYIVNPRRMEQMRRETDAMLVSNSTLMVQAFFLMSSFLLANKLLQQRRRQLPLRPLATFAETMINRVIRMSPSYFVVVWAAASGWARGGRGPLWAPLVAAEAAVCRAKWWTHLLYLNNLLYPDDKCLIQTWYLAADMQLYACALLLTLALWRLRRGALWALAALLAAAVLAALALALAWGLVPTYVLHRPEAMRALYRGDASFNALYQSPLGNAPGMLAGLLLAHVHHELLRHGVRLAEYRWFRVSAWVAPWLAAGWVPASAWLAAAGGPAPAVAALAATERTVFALLVAVALLGAMHGVQSPVRSLLSWRGWAAPARLSFGALLLHMLINKSLLAARLQPVQIDRQAVILEWFGVAVASYMAALPLALLVELPVQRLYRALRGPARAPPPAPAPKAKPGM